KNKPPKKSKEKPLKGSKNPPKGSEKPPKGSKKPKEKPPKATKPSGKKPPVPPSPPTESPPTLQPSQGKEDEEIPESRQPLTLSPGELEEPPNERWGLGREGWNPEPQPEVPEDPEPPTLDYNEQLEREDYEDFEYIRRQQKPPKPPSRRRPERVWPQPEETPEPEEPLPQPLPQPPLPDPVTEGDYGEGFEPPDYDDWTYGLPPPTKPHEHLDKEDRMETDKEKIRP
ncbi:AEBP1 protein, partial [Buphagus erythrorhynchus]|nr:AEBP1 protein [Buphagus erythrorhynchus]